jgi:hypothetical protein
MNEYGAKTGRPRDLGSREFDPSVVSSRGLEPTARLTVVNLSATGNGKLTVPELHVARIAARRVTRPTLR